MVNASFQYPRIIVVVIIIDQVHWLAQGQAYLSYLSVVDRNTSNTLRQRKLGQDASA